MEVNKADVEDVSNISLETPYVLPDAADSVIFEDFHKKRFMTGSLSVGVPEASLEQKLFESLEKELNKKTYGGNHYNVDNAKFLQRSADVLTKEAVIEVVKEAKEESLDAVATQKRAIEMLSGLNEEFHKIIDESKKVAKEEEEKERLRMEELKSLCETQLLQKVNSKAVEKEAERERKDRMNFLHSVANANLKSEEDCARTEYFARINQVKKKVQSQIRDAAKRSEENEKNYHNEFKKCMMEVKDYTLQTMLRRRFSHQADESKKKFRKTFPQGNAPRAHDYLQTEPEFYKEDKEFKTETKDNFVTVLSQMMKTFEKVEEEETEKEKAVMDETAEKKCMVQEDLVRKCNAKKANKACVKERVRRIQEAKENKDLKEHLKERLGKVHQQLKCKVGGEELQGNVQGKNVNAKPKHLEKNRRGEPAASE